MATREVDDTFLHGKNGVITTHSHALAGFVFGAVLADDDVTDFDVLTAGFFEPETFAFARRLSMLINTTAGFNM